MRGKWLLATWGSPENIKAVTQKPSNTSGQQVRHEKSALGGMIREALVVLRRTGVFP